MNRIVRNSLLALTAFAPLTMFQNCSDVSFKELPVNNSSLSLQSASISINNGDRFTRDENVMVQLRVVGGSEMYVTDDPTCADGGVWEPLRSERGWILSRSNGEAYVYAKFRHVDAKGVEEVTPCVSASIIHDDTPPVVTYDRRPGEFTQNASERIEFSVRDNLSGVNSAECRLDGAPYELCERVVDVNNISEGLHRFAIRAVDKAGNVSAAFELPWLVDRTRPTVQINDPKPAPVTQSNTATFTFEGDDGMGSGIERFFCQVTGSPAVECQSPFVITSLTDGEKTFSVYAVDRVGLQSAVASYTWRVDTVPSGAFDVLGITGARDNKVDAYLAGDVYPKVNWSGSDEAVRYEVEIRDLNGNIVCPKASTTALNYQFSNSCALINGISYNAHVVAYDEVNNARAATPFRFTVDIEGPEITIGAPVLPVDHKSARMVFSVTDAISGVDTAVCSHTYNNVVTQTNCKNLTELNLANLLPGTHKFNIAATDIAGNASAGNEISFILEKRTLEMQTAKVEDVPKKIDVLMVIDNSGSMDEERKKLSEKLNDFISKLSALDWRICITTTSPTNDGVLRPFGSGSQAVYAIDKNTPKYNDLFIKTVTGNLGNNSGDEQGIYATVRAIETNDSRCFRNDASMAVVVISDEDERSWGGYDEYKNQSQWKPLNDKNLPRAPVDAIAALNARLNLRKIFTFHSIVIKYAGTPDTACKKESNGQYGRRYEEASALTSGIVGSICAPNYGTELAKMGERIAESLATITLRCAPVENTLQVNVVNAAPGQTYTLNGDKVNFTPALSAGSTVNFQYYCRE